MKLLVRRSVQLDAVDEKFELLGEMGVVLIGGEIDNSTVGGLFANLLTRLSSENISSENKKVWVILDSPGGSLYQGLAVHDLLKAIALQGWEVNIISLGQVASMAVCILQAGTKRYSFPNTQFTVHQASLYSEGEQVAEVNKLSEDARELKRVNHVVLKIIAERSGMEMKELLRRSKKTDYSMGPSSAKAFGKNGLIDEVITTFPFLING